MILLKVDNLNFIIAIVGYVIVFAALYLLYIVFNFLPKILKFSMKINFKRTKPEEVCDKCGEFLPDIENAAIATTLFLYFSDLHDEENTIITIKKVKKDYSPWSSKIYGVSSFQK
jgi:hypothetical protein